MLHQSNTATFLPGLTQFTRLRGLPHLTQLAGFGAAHPALPTSLPTAKN